VIESASAEVVGDRVRASWRAGDGDLFCGLWRTSDAIEVCCGDDNGTRSLATTGAVLDVRLSRGRRIRRDGELDVYRTTETANLIGE